MYKDTSEERSAHPGWAVQFDDGSWLCTVHGIYQVTDAFYAKSFSSLEDAHLEMAIAIKDGDFPEDIKYEVIPAWEPLCESLRIRIDSLKQANKIEPHDIMEMISSLESVLYTLKDKI